MTSHTAYIYVIIHVRCHVTNIVLNGTSIQWQKSVKRLGNIVSCDLSEKEEIRAKQLDFIGRTNSVIANFKGVVRSTLSKVFVSHCCHYYGAQAWSLTDRSLPSFYTCWRKAIRKLWCIPNIARSSLLPLLVCIKKMQEEVISRIAYVYSSIYKGHNSKILNLLQHSINLEHMGIMGGNIRSISKHWRCGFELLVNNNVISCDSETQSRVKAIRELTQCLENARILMDCHTEEILLMRNHIATY